MIDDNFVVPGIVDLVRSRFEHSQTVFKAQHMRCARWYDVYRSWWQGAYQPFRNNVTLPLLFSACWSDVGRKVNISLNVNPPLAMEGGGPEDMPLARKNEVLLAAQLRDAHTLRKSIDILLTGNLYGTAVARHGWKFVERMLLKRGAEYGASGARYEKQLLEKRTLYDGPDWEPIDILDFFPQPGRRYIHEMDWMIVRYIRELDDLLEMSTDENPVYDRPAVTAIQNLGMRQNIRDETEARFTVRRNPFVTDVARSRFDRPVEIIEMWGLVPSDMGYETRLRVISLANRQTPIRNRALPFWSGLPPFEVYSPLTDPHYFHGIGKIEIGEKLQLTANRLVSHKLDVMDQTLDPTWGVDINKIIDQSEVFSKPGHMIRTDGPSSEVLQPMTPDLRGMQISYQEVADIDRQIQKGTGIVEDVSQGMTSSRSTAREFLGRQEAVSIRLLLESRNFEEMFFEPLGEAFRWLNRQFLPLPYERQILGFYASMDPVTGQPVPPESLTVDDEVVNRDYNVRARGATMSMTKAVRQQNLVLLYQTMASNPLMAQYINWHAFQREMFSSFDIKNVDELLTPPPQMQAAVGAAGATGPPQPGGPGGAPPPPEGQMPLESIMMNMLPGAQQEGQLDGTMTNS